jgi:site-specific recombinase XerD
MSSLTPNVSPLRQRMIDDMRMRKFNGKTQIHYIRAVRRLAAFLKRSPDTATAEDLRAFQLHMVDTGTAPPTINSTLSGLKFFFDVTLGRGELLVKVQPVHQPRPLPVVLSCDEVARLIAAAPNAKYQAALSVAYGAGLRANEVCMLKVADIDSERMTLRVEQGKGRKAPLCLAVASTARAAARMVASRPCPGQAVAQRMALPGTEPHGPAVHPAAQPCDPPGRRRGTDRQARVNAYLAP